MGLSPDELLAQAAALVDSAFATPSVIDEVRRVLVESQGQAWAGANIGWTTLDGGDDLFVGFRLSLVVDGGFLRGIGLDMTFVSKGEDGLWVVHPSIRALDGGPGLYWPLDAFTRSPADGDDEDAGSSPGEAPSSPDADDEGVPPC